MKQSAIGLNIHIGYVKDWGTLLARLDQLQPMANLCHIDSLDQMKRVWELQQRYPQTQLIVRMYTTPERGLPKEGDYHLPGERGPFMYEPWRFVADHESLGRNGLMLNAQNEPSGYAQLTGLSAWHQAAVAAATASGVRLAGPAFGKGHPALGSPDDSEWDAALIPLLKAYGKSDGRHWLNLHEYDHKERDGNNYLFGRYVRMVAACERRGLEKPDFVITEWGIDYGGQGSGYKAQGMDGPAYAEWLVGALNEVYRDAVQRGKLKGLCIFCYGNSGGWETFDVEPDKDFWERLLAIVPRWVLIPAPPEPEQPPPVVIEPVTPEPEPEPTPEPAPGPEPEPPAPEPAPGPDVAAIKAGLAQIMAGLQMVYDAL